MITTNERNELKQVLGAHYTSEVLNQLKADGVLNSSNKPHSAQMVRVVFNGARHHEEIEAAIYKVYAAKKKELRKLKRKRQSILKS